MFLASGQAARAEDRVATWHSYEITLTAAKSYANPYKEVAVSAVFTGPAGERMVMPGFWDGGHVWRIRFAPPTPGRWRYGTTSSAAHDPGLQGRSGAFTAVRYTGKLAIFRRGFLKISADNRYLTYGDGTPFYWLGDTNWGGFSSAVPWAGAGRGPFRTIVDRRVKQGFTVWKAETFANNDEAENAPVNEGGFAWRDHRYFGEPNPAFWQEIDRRVRYVADSGMVLSIAQGIGRSLKTGAMTEDHRRLALYILARYGAYPTVWITAQEFNLESRNSTVCGQCWADIARSVYEADPYKRPNSLHSRTDNPITYHDQPWYGFVTLQEGHGASHPVDYWLKQYHADPPRPVLEDEANYDHIIPLYAGSSETMTRQSAWMSQIGGAFGFTYGAQGIWYGCVDKISPNPNCGAGKDGYTWREALEFPVGNTQLGAMRAFWTALPWWTLHPDEHRIAWNDAPRDSQRPFQKSNADHSILVAYLPATVVRYTGTLTAVPGTRPDARWFDPRTGTYSQAAIRRSGNSAWIVPSKPTGEDWVLLIRQNRVQQGDVRAR
ncbi:apiosidase-like domain-containing protein [Sphingomonas sp. PAMC 26605]|uniref:apiosidase-like domain-containing protein n=1 Tax=Sphingomonas sp. PAMC 26605 TaxID=1112214 RepID=UPI00026CABAB|nr:DUF4038 domain-containing protein [Sphingomonas sp. PAMC 26605]